LYEELCSFLRYLNQTHRLSIPYFGQDRITMSYSCHWNSGF